MAELRKPKPGRPFRYPWDYVEYDTFFKGVDTSGLPPISFESWVPLAVVDEANKIYAECPSRDDPLVAVEPLRKLISDIRMKRVWAELYKKTRDGHKVTDQFANPIHIYPSLAVARDKARLHLVQTQGGSIEEIQEIKDLIAINEQIPDPDDALLRWTEQEVGVQQIFWRIYTAAINTDVHYFSELQRLAKALSQSAKILNIAIDGLSSQRIATEIESISSRCEDLARSFYLAPDAIVRDRGKYDVRLRTFIVNVNRTMFLYLRKEMYRTVATIANVVFDRYDLSGNIVREMIRN
jgi:hypothetical protein